MLTKIMLWWKNNRKKKYRFRYYKDGFLTHKEVYKLEMKYFNLIWVKIKSGSVNNYFYKEELEEVQEKLKTGEYCIKDFKLQENFYIKDIDFEA